MLPTTEVQYTSRFSSSLTFVASGLLTFFPISLSGFVLRMPELLSVQHPWYLSLDILVSFSLQHFCFSYWIPGPTGSPPLSPCLGMTFVQPVQFTRRFLHHTVEASIVPPDVNLNHCNFHCLRLSAYFTVKINYQLLPGCSQFSPAHVYLNTLSNILPGYRDNKVLAFFTITVRGNWFNHY